MQLGHRDKLVGFEMKRSKVRVTARSNRQFGMYFFTCLWNALTYFNEIYHSHSPPGLLDTDGMLKVVGSKVKITANFLAETY